MNTKELEQGMNEAKQKVIDITQQIEELKKEKKYWEKKTSFCSKYLKRSAKLDADEERRRESLRREMDKELNVNEDDSAEEVNDGRADHNDTLSGIWKEGSEKFDV